ncbi:MAG: glutamine synthetase [Deltaproteobacteria bacterium]|nr:glutamine synthetase [Deltaproteobacteria bacterium]
MTENKIETLIGSGELETIILAFPDQYTRLMGKRLTASHYLDLGSKASIHACDYLLAADLDLNPLPGFKLASWEEGYGDHILKPDMSTFRILPWYEKTAILICDLFHENEEAVAESPRNILKNQLQALTGLGLTPIMASELEFYLFKGGYDQAEENGFSELEPSTPFRIDYFVAGTNRDEDVLREVRSKMSEAGIEIEGSKGEWERGQHEVNLKACPALEMADRHVIFKDGVKSIAAKHGKAATFMAKVDENLAGSSCHIHLSLVDENNNNAFWDHNLNKPSEIFEHFLAGCLANTGSLSLFLAPNINSYKRYRAASFAPTSLAWGTDNRTCGFRVVGREHNFRIECRIPGADANPYLAFSALLASGMDGLAQKLALPGEQIGNAYENKNIRSVSTSLSRAIACFKEQDFAMKAFGAGVAEHYLKLATLELEESERVVSNWEKRRYFERA